MVLSRLSSNGVFSYDRRVHAQLRDLKILLAKATPARSGDALAGVSAEDEEERALARWRWLTFRWRGSWKSC